MKLLLRGITATLLMLSTGVTAQLTLRKTQEEFLYSDPPFASCHASTIVEVAPGRFIAAAFGGTHESHKDVCIWLSEQNGREWSTPSKIADGIVHDSLRYPTWNPVLFKAREGRLFLFYKVGPSPSKWWGMVRTSEDNGTSWSAPQRLPEGILGPIKNKPVQLANGDILSPSSTENYVNDETWPWKVHMERSADLGTSWERVPVDPGSRFNAIQPSILVHPDGTLQILCRSRENAIVQAFSEDGGRNWGELTKTSLTNPNSGTDALTLQNGRYLLVYNPTMRQEGTEGRSRLHVAVSEDGIRWADTMVLENEEKGEFSYPAVIQATDGNIHIIYTYNRVNIKHVVLELQD